MQPTSLTTLDDLLTELGKQPSPENDLVREHLDSARFYIVGAMPQELAFSLNLAEEAGFAMPDSDLKRKVNDFIETSRAEARS